MYGLIIECKAFESSVHPQLQRQLAARRLRRRYVELQGEGESVLGAAASARLLTLRSDVQQRVPRAVPHPRAVCVGLQMRRHKGQQWRRPRRDSRGEVDDGGIGHQREGIRLRTVAAEHRLLCREALQLGRLGKQSFR